MPSGVNPTEAGFVPNYDQLPPGAEADSSVVAMYDPKAGKVVYLDGRRPVQINPSATSGVQIGEGGYSHTTTGPDTEASALLAENVAIAARMTKQGTSLVDLMTGKARAETIAEFVQAGSVITPPEFDGEYYPVHEEVPGYSEPTEDSQYDESDGIDDLFDRPQDAGGSKRNVEKKNSNSNRAYAGNLLIRGLRSGAVKGVIGTSIMFLLMADAIDETAQSVTHFVMNPTLSPDSSYLLYSTNPFMVFSDLKHLRG